MHVRPPVAIVAVALAPLVAGCGGSSATDNGVAAKSPTAIVAAAQSAATSARSFHVAGSGVDKGSPVRFDLNIVTGKGGSGRLSQSGLSFELIRIGDAAYVKGDASFWRRLGGTTAVQLLGGKWLKGSATSGDLASLVSLTDTAKLFAGMLGSHGTLAKAGTTTVGGVKAVRIADTSQGGTLDVATTGKPYPLDIAQRASGGGKITFDRWNGSVALSAPADAIDIAKLRTG